jgi:hypothetical protein
MPEYPRQLIIKQPLWAFMCYCEIYCSAACCGRAAFQVHHALILRKVIDENLAGRDGSKLFELAWQQLRDVIAFVNATELICVHNEVPIWNDEPVELPQYSMPVKEFKDWLLVWDGVFTEAARYIVSKMK